MTTGFTVPVIDLAGEAASVDRAIAAACASWGFFQVVHHGIPGSLVQSCLQATRDFFAMPKAHKRALSRSRESPWGFYDRELTKNTRDKKEVFDIGPELTEQQL